MRPLVLAVALAAALDPASSRAESYRGYAEVPYTVERQAGAVEVRRYPPRTVAEVIVKGDRSAAIQRGFGELFGYIAGENEADGKIAMTVPVDQTQTGRGWAIRFTMPEGATPESLPAPDKSHVRLRRLPAERMLVGRFSGRATPERLDQAADALRAYAAKTGMTLTGAPQIMFYDDPFTMPWNRRNEVAFTVAR